MVSTVVEVVVVHAVEEENSVVGGEGQEGLIEEEVVVGTEKDVVVVEWGVVSVVIEDSLFVTAMKLCPVCEYEQGEGEEMRREGGGWPWLLVSASSA
jgi:hypothetical protein